MKRKTGNYATQYQMMVSLISANFMLHKCILISLFDVRKIRCKFAIKIAKHVDCIMQTKNITQNNYQGTCSAEQTGASLNSRDLHILNCAYLAKTNYVSRD